MAVGFNGSNQSLTPSAAPASSSGVFTCSLWARVNDVTSRQAILGSWDWSSGGYQWVIEFGDGGTGNGFTATHYPAEFSWDVIESFVAPGSTWHHLCFVANAGSVPQLWVDGAQSNGSTASLSTVSHVDFRIGGYLGDNNYGQVDVAHVGIWNTNLGASDIAQLADRYAPDLVRRGSLQNYWEFTGGLYLPKVGPVTLTAPNGSSKVEAPPIILSSRPALVAVPAAVGGVTATGQTVTITAAHGTPVPATTAPVTGEALSITLAHGTAVPRVSPAVDGQALSVTVAHGAVALAVAVAVDGQAASITAEHGSVTVPDSALEGRELSITVAHGTLSPATTVAATGQGLSITAAHGTATPQVNAPVTGQTLSVSVAHGTVSPDVSKVVTGRALTITATHGNVSVSGPVVGQSLSITVAHGSPVPAVARAATGQSLTITTAHGSVTVSILAPVQFGKPRLRSVVEFGKPRTRSIIEFGKPRTRPAAGVLSPLQLPGALFWYNADVVTTSGTDITAWPNLITDVSATAGGTIAPEIEVVNGRNWVRCYGDGSTVDVGSWFTATEAAVLAAFRHVNSQANFYLAITYQALANADGENVLFAASQGAANLHISRLAVNTNFTNRRATFLAGSGAGVQGLWRDVTPIDYDVHVIEILSTPDSYREIRVDGELTEAPGYAYTTGDQNAFDVFVIGSEVRNSVYNAPANARLRDVIAASDTTAAQRQSIRQFAAARAGISL